LERPFPLEELGGFGNSQSLLPFLHPETAVLVYLALFAGYRTAYSRILVWSRRTKRTVSSGEVQGTTLDGIAYLHSSTAASETATPGPAMLHRLNAWHAAM
jgi:hypothetical protein